MKQFFISILLFVSTAISLSASEISSLRTGEDRSLPSGTVVEGILVSDFRSANNALNPNKEWNRVDYTMSRRVAYLQAPDGSCGVRLIFSIQYLTKFTRNSLVSVDLSGCRLQVSKDPESYTVLDVDPGKVTVRQTDVAPAAKFRKLSELTDADIYTQVTLTGLEYLSKQGSFANVYEECTKASAINYTIRDLRFGAADGWAQLLEDAEGNSIYVQVNSLCQWRRNNSGVPKGVGNVTGVIVNEENPRYGRSFGRYSIRPLFREDISIPSEMATSFKLISFWAWDRNYDCGLLLRKAGRTDWISSPGITDDAVVSETGNGLLYTDSGCELCPSIEYDTRYCTDMSGKGGRLGGSLCFKGYTSNWLHPESSNSSITVQSSTKGATGKGLIFNFSFLAGSGSYKSSLGIPAEWTVEYSTDGVKFEPTGFKACLRPLAWKMDSDKKLGLLPASYSAAMGFTEFSVLLPASLLDRDKVFVRLIPSSLVLASAKADPSMELNTESFHGENNRPVTIQIGMIALKAY